MPSKETFNEKLQQVRETFAEHFTVLQVQERDDPTISEVWGLRPLGMWDFVNVLFDDEEDGLRVVLPDESAVDPSRLRDDMVELRTQFEAVAQSFESDNPHLVIIEVIKGAYPRITDDEVAAVVNSLIESTGTVANDMRAGLRHIALCMQGTFESAVIGDDTDSGLRAVFSLETAFKIVDLLQSKRFSDSPNQRLAERLKGALIDTSIAVPLLDAEGNMRSVAEVAAILSVVGRAILCYIEPPA